MKVGQQIYGYHCNSNRAHRDGTRRYMDLPCGWESYIVSGETKQSWIVNNFMKINKKTMEERETKYTPIRFVEDIEEVIKQEFVTRNGLASKIMYCKDYDKLKAIEAILEG